MKDLILGVETSCDDTCVCLMSWFDGHIEYNKSIHQDDTHRKFGGIVPNLASECHLNAINILKTELQKQDLMRIAGIACTTGPGLIGSLLVGVSFAKGLAMSLGVPFIRINHLEGHALSCFIEHSIDEIQYPYLLLLVSGGNSQIILAKDLGCYTIIGETLDDAAGEALDKIAKYLNIGYPGGVNLEKLSLQSKDHKRFQFKDGCINKNTFNFSFSGLKTQVLYKIQELGGIENIDINTKIDIAYSAQEAVFETLKKKIQQVINTYKDQALKQIKTIVICGGVSANKTLSSKIHKLAQDKNLNLVIPSLQWTTDNAGMIAKAGCMYWNAWKQNKRMLSYNTMDLSFSPLSKWRIDNICAFK